jgi:response regulator NasT
VILAFESEKTSAHIRDIVESAGLAGCLVCHSAAEVKRIIHKQQVATVVCGYKLPDETAELLFEDLPLTCSMLVIAKQNLLVLIGNDDIFKLAAPVSRNDLLSSIRMLIQVGHRMEKFIRPQRSEEEQALIEQAKAVLVGRHDMTEEQAHRFLQKKSMDSGVRLAQTAQMVLDEVWNG